LPSLSDEQQKAGPSDESKQEQEKKDQQQVTVKFTRGSWAIEITCAPDRVQQAVESVLKGMTSKEGVVLEGVEPVEPETDKKFGTCRGLLLTMWKEGWFAEPRQLSEVHDEMARRGFHYDRTAVAHSLVDLVREGTLFRDGSMRNYRYVQKFPHTRA
jgi:hypothetical protein